MRWPWQNKKPTINSETRELIDAFNAGLEEIRVVAGDLRETNRELRLQMGKEEVARGRSREGGNS